MSDIESAPPQVVLKDIPGIDPILRLRMVRLSANIHSLASAAESMEGAAISIVERVYEDVRDPGTGERFGALARLFVTLPYSALTADLQESARTSAGSQPVGSRTPCLTMLATRGDVPDWNSRFRSHGHKAIPLTSEEALQQSPMISRLMSDFGVDLQQVFDPRPELMLKSTHETYNIFHVADAVGSAFVPAQSEFVMPHGIRSVVGFGAPLPTGQMFAVILFSRVPIPPELASIFSTIALSAKLSLIRFSDGPIFESN